MNAEWNGLPIWGWTVIGVVTAAGAYLFIRRWRNAKAAAPTDTTTVAPLGASASWGGGSLPTSVGGIGLPAGTTTTTTPSGAGVNTVPAGTPANSYRQPPTVSMGLPAWGGPGGPLNETQAPGVASYVYTGDAGGYAGGWTPLVDLGPSGIGSSHAYGPPPGGPGGYPVFGSDPGALNAAFAAAGLGK